MLNQDDTTLTEYKFLNNRKNSIGLTDFFARTDLTHWLYTSIDGDDGEAVHSAYGRYSGYGSEAEMNKDKKYLAANGVILIAWGYLEKV